MKLADLEAYLQEYLALARFSDEAVNGLQVEGRPEVKRLALAVSACREVFLKAASAGADAILVHHGLFWKGEGPLPLRGPLGRRIRILFEKDLSLLAYHLPLDAHPEVGNNAVAARDLGLVELEPFAVYHGTPIGFRGRFPEPVPRADFVARLETYYGHRAFVEPAGPDPISTVAVCSGGAAREARDAAAAGLDAYVTGEAGEPEVFLAREAGLTFAALGHHATERVGVRALGRHLASLFGLDTVFLDVDNQA